MARGTDAWLPERSGAGGHHYCPPLYPPPTRESGEDRSLLQAPAGREAQRADGGGAGGGRGAGGLGRPEDPSAGRGRFGRFALEMCAPLLCRPLPPPALHPPIRGAPRPQRAAEAWAPARRGDAARSTTPSGHASFAEQHSPSLPSPSRLIVPDSAEF